VKLYEKSPVKRAFLSNIKEKLDIRNLDIANDVYEEEILADIIVCRAFKKLEEILKISRETVKKPHKLIILKGKNAQSEINNVSLGSNYSYKLENSITDHDSKIIIVDVK
jgi:16S rRNA G527 N7-methylase RsmG